jgi:flavodoxin
MKILTTYYSKTGNTKKIAKKISEILKTDIDEIIDKTDRKGIKGWIFGGRDAMREKDTEIKYSKDPSKYDIVIIGTPVWAFTLTPAVRTYFKENNANKLKNVAFFYTCGGTPGKTLAEMEKLSKKPIATLDIRDKEINSFDIKIKNFCEEIKKRIKN